MDRESKQGGRKEDTGLVRVETDRKAEIRTDRQTCILRETQRDRQIKRQTRDR